MLATLHYFSQTLNCMAVVNVLLPEPRALGFYEAGAPVGRDMQVLYLLHGYKGGPSEWQRKSAVERYVHEKNRDMIVVIPGMYNFFYTNMAYGPRYFDFIADEVPRVVRGYFHVSQRREDTFVAGLSMGGYGALKLALTYPERYGFAASFSGAVDPFAERDLSKVKDDKMRAMLERIDRESAWIFGPKEDRRGSGNDLYALLETCGPQNAPPIYQSCGECDTLFDANMRFRDRARELGYRIDWHQAPDTAHEWRFWDGEVEKLIDKLPR